MIHRISRHQMFMDMAEVAAKRSTCFRGNTGALIVLDNDIVSMGYNGPPSGEPHCLGNGCELNASHGCLRSDHAEKNAVDRALKKLGRPIVGIGAILYCTSCPCLNCADKVWACGINRIYFRYPYRLPQGLQFLLTEGCDVYQITPSGFIIDQRTKEIVSD